MKQLILIGALGLSAALYSQQIPNAGFETWIMNVNNSLEPQGWQTPNDASSGYEPVKQVTGRTGAYAMRVYTPTVVGMTLPSATLMGFNSTLRPLALNGYYKGVFAANDSSYITVSVIGDGVGTGAGVKYFKTNQSAFTAFSIPINYSNSDPIDSISIAVASGTAAPATAGADLTVDDLTLELAAGIEMSLQTGVITSGYRTAENLQFFVTPQAQGRLQVRIYNLAGQELVASDFQLHSGKNEVLIPIADLPAGTYMLKMDGAGVSYTGKMAL